MSQRQRLWLRASRGLVALFSVPVIFTACKSTEETAAPAPSAKMTTASVTMTAAPARLASSATSCPSTLADWTTWRDQAIARLLYPRLNQQKEAYIDTSQVLATAVGEANYIDDCAASFSSAAQLSGAIGNFKGFTNILRNTLSVPNYDHQFGYTIDDFDYLDKVKNNVALPDLLKSQDFLRKVSNKSTYRDAFKMINDHNASLPADKRWTVLLYKSRFLTTPDAANTFGRFFVLVPGDEYEKWIQFGIKLPGDSDPTPVNNLSIVSVAKPDAQGRRFNAIIDWWRTYLPDGSISVETRRKSQGVTESCIMCHKTSPLGIHPAEEYVLDGSGNLVPNTLTAGAIPKMLNSLIQEYGPPYFNGWTEPTRYGPPLGEDKPRTDDFMQACTTGLGLDAASIQRVKRKMTCTDCHSSLGAGAVGLLNFPETTRSLKTPGNQIYQYLTQGWMPPNQQITAEDQASLNQAPQGNRLALYRTFASRAQTSASLTTNEREALYECLTKEYFDIDKQTGTFIDWLKTNSPAFQAAALVSPRVVRNSTVE